jgi:hypothetical protein
MLLKVAPPARISNGTVARTVRTCPGAVEGVGAAGLLPPPPQAENAPSRVPHDTIDATVRILIAETLPN